MDKTLKSKSNKFVKTEMTKQSQEDDMVHLMLSLLMDLRASTNDEKTAIYKRYLKKLERLEIDHIDERSTYAEWFERAHTDKIKQLAKNIGKTIQLDVRSSTYVLELYEILVLEDRDESEVAFTIKTADDNQDAYVSELRAMLTKQKKEALSEIVKLITLIHNIIDYQDQDNILERYHPFVLVSEQNKDLQILQDKLERLRDWNVLHPW